MKIFTYWWMKKIAASFFLYGVSLMNTECWLSLIPHLAEDETFITFGTWEAMVYPDI